MKSYRIPVIFLGKKYSSQRELCREIGVAHNLVSQAMKYGHKVLGHEVEPVKNKIE